MASYVLTGASGHIGNNMARSIKRMDPEASMTALSRREIGRELAGVSCRVVVGDLFDTDFLRDNIGQNDIVIHMAGYIDLTDKHPEETYRVNVELTRILTDVCESVGVRRYIYMGSVDGLSRPEEDGEIAEPSVFDPDGIKGHYGKSKAMAMQYVAEKAAACPDFSCAMVLPSAVIGENDFRPSAAGGVIRSVLRGGAEFGIRGGYNFVDVEDVCAATYTLCHNDERGMFILSGENVSVAELYRAINQKKGYRRPVILLPVWLVRLFLPFVRVLNKITLKALTDPHKYSCARARERLGYDPTPFSKTLDKTIAFFEGERKK
ncbi:MAG: NAD-dependent epimerase/dehydratase family protein [Clostridia bacterium]|nr:NAD-dependent epimerase/dehydratase family protein [Clostridia bacterium]MBQ8859676.1 NAD-dependent epimerase/dehydratase family protein [Clostridia bacterium]